MRRSLLIAGCIAALTAHAQFGPPRIIEEAETPRPVTALADLDGDGDNDLLALATNFYQWGRVVWYANDGSGSFGPRQLIFSSTEWSGAAGLDVGDIDGDGDVDVLTSQIGNTVMYWFENDGTGSFTQQTIPSTGDPCRAHSLVDMDGDGDLDVVGESQSNVKWFENDGTGNFGPEHTIDLLSSFTYFTTTSDIDGDGDVDLITASSYTDGLYWFANDGSGNFGAQQTIAIGVDGANHCAAADLDGDGDQDVLSAAFNENTIAWYANDGAGNFGPQQVISTAVEYAIFVNTADLDGDGDNDVLSASVTDNKVAWYENRGDGNFYEQQVISTAAYWALSIVTGDVDGDGDLDVFSNSQGDDKIAWYENQGNLGFGPQQVLTVSARIPIITRTADLDGDGDPDVLVGMTSHSRIAWYENLGGGLTGPQQEITSQVADLRDLRTADLDGDGDLDLLSASFEDHKFAWYANDGSGGFGPQQLIGTVVGGPVSICPADLDGDGDQDVLGGHSELERYMNDGLGNFTPLPPVAGFHGVLSSVDIDGDGDLDCLANGMLGMLGAIVWARNDGLGGFGTDRFISFAWGRSLTAADMDGDGDPDVISSSYESDTLVWYPNNGLGVFGSPQVISSLVTNVFQVLAADIDADGDQDVLSASYDDDEFAWYQNDGSGVFGPQLIIDATVDGANCIATTDMDGDGDLDLVGAGYSDIDVVWYENHVGSLYRIDGTVFMDADQNGSFDGADIPFPYAPVSITPMLSTVMSGAAGTYTAFVDTGTFALESVLSAPLWTLTTSPAVRSIQITTLEPQVAGVDFGWAPAIDTSIVLPGFTLGTGPCGSTVHSWLSYRNLGTRIEQGTITLELDPVFSFVSSIPPPSTVVGNTVTWEFDSLGWFGIGQIPMEIQLPPSATDWTSTTTAATVDSLGASTGVFTLPQSGFIGCAYDPNDKQVEPQGYGIHGAVAIDTEWLTYTIRFQNTGTGTAYNVSIIDQLDGDLDRSSLEILGTSHPITSMQIDAAGKAIFRFNNIMLPDSNVSRSASQGYLRYRIRPAEGAADGTQITNAASILFDLNPAIVTNTVTNTLVDCSLFSAEIGWGNVDSLVANAGDNYQWYFEGDSIAGATDQWLLATDEGSYTVEVRSIHGCVDVSDPYDVLITGLMNEEPTRMRILPNPTSGNAHLFCSEVLGAGDRIELVDLHGRTLRSWRGNGTREVIIERGGLSSGVYMIRALRDGSRLATVRLVME